MKIILTTMSIIVLYVSFSMFESNDVRFMTTVKPPVIIPVAMVSEPKTYAHQEISDALRRAGFNDDQIPLMLAIAGGESHWRIDAIGDTTITNKTWGVSVGIFQIRTLKTASKGCRDYDQLMNNLDAQASCAYQIWQSQGYKAWSAYSNGSYKNFL